VGGRRRRRSSEPQTTRRRANSPSIAFRPRSWPLASAAGDARLIAEREEGGGGIHSSAAEPRQAFSSSSSPSSSFDESSSEPLFLVDRAELFLAPNSASSSEVSTESEDEEAAMDFLRGRFRLRDRRSQDLDSATALVRDCRRKRLQGEKTAATATSEEEHDLMSAAGEGAARRRRRPMAPHHANAEKSQDETRTAQSAISKRPSLRRRRETNAEDTDDANPTKKGNFEAERNGHQRRATAASDLPMKNSEEEAEEMTTKYVAEKERVEDEAKIEEDEDPLGFIEIKSAAQWKAMAGRIRFKFEDEEQSPDQTATEEAAGGAKPAYKFTVRLGAAPAEVDGSSDAFQPTKVQQLRLICWRTKPWAQPPMGAGGKRLFGTQFAAPWGADCDEVFPCLFVGDKNAASKPAFLRRIGVTHVLNAAEGDEEGLVNLSQDSYVDTGITYLGFPLWDTPTCNIIPYLGCAADFIDSAMAAGGKCLVNCQMGVSRSAACAIAYLMIKKGMTAGETLTQFRRCRDVRPNDGFLEQVECRNKPIPTENF